MAAEMTNFDSFSFEGPRERAAELTALVHLLRYAERESAEFSPEARRLIEQAADELDSMRCLN